MRMFYITTAFFIVLVTYSSIAVCQEGALASVDSEAEELLLAFVTSRDEVPRELAVLGRGIRFSVNGNSEGPSEQESWFVEATSSGESRGIRRYSAFGLSRIENGLARPFLWEQTLIVDGERFTRSGSATSRGAHEQRESQDVKPSERKAKRLTPIFDPYYLGFCDNSSLMLSRVTESFGLDILGSATLTSSKRTDKGRIQGVWDVGTAGWKMLIEFDASQGNRPVKSVWSLQQPKVTNGERIIYSVTETHWKLTETSKEDTKSLWLPVEVKRVDFRTDQSAQTESEHQLIWKCDDNIEFPDPEDNDWREPFRMLFGVEWMSPYADFLESMNATPY